MSQFTTVSYTRLMAPKKDEVEIRPDNVLSLATALRKVSLQRDKMKSSRYRQVVAIWKQNLFLDDLFRCTEEVSAWTTKVSRHIKNTQEGLLEALEQIHKGVEVNPHLKYQIQHTYYLINLLQRMIKVCSGGRHFAGECHQKRRVDNNGSRFRVFPPSDQPKITSSSLLWGETCCLL